MPTRALILTPTPTLTPIPTPTTALALPNPPPNPGGAREKSLGKEPHCEPLTYALRNGAPDEVVQALLRFGHDAGNPTLPGVSGEVDAFGNDIRSLGRSHSQLRKCNACDMRKLWKGLDQRAKGLRRLLGDDAVAAG